MASTLHLCDADSFLLLTLKDSRCHAVDFCDFASCRFSRPDAEMHEFLSHLPHVSIVEMGSKIVASCRASLCDTHLLVEMLLGTLKKVLVAADWEWIPCQFASHEVLGDLQPKSETAAPTKAVMNAIRCFLFEISLAAIAKPSGTHVVLKYNGILFWGGLLEESLALHDLGAVVHTVLACIEACIEEKTPRWIKGARRIYLEGDLSQCNTNSRDNVTFHLCSPFHGGGGKTDTWKEAKSLL